MKIIQINASYKPAYIYGGPTLSVSRLCEGLTRKGAHVEVITTSANGKEELSIEMNKSLLIDGVNVTFFRRLTKDHSHFSPALLKHLYNLLSTNASIIVHIHAWWNLVSIFSCLIAKLKNKPVVLSPRGTLSTYSFGNKNIGIKKFIHKYLGKTLLEYCHLHVTSQQEKIDMLKLVSPKSITVISNFVFLPEIDERQAGEKIQEPRNQIQEAVDEIQYVGKERDPIKLLFLSRVEEKKGLDILFHALSQLEMSYNLTIAGTGELMYIDNLKSLAKTLNLTQHINWIGQQNQDEKWEILKNHDFFILPSHNENFANVVIECLAMGTPVILSSKVGLADYVANNNLGWIAEPDAKALTTAIMQAISETKKAAAIRLKAPSLIRKDFQEDVLIDHYIEMYHTILNN